MVHHAGRARHPDGGDAARGRVAVPLIPNPCGRLRRRWRERVVTNPQSQIPNHQKKARRETRRAFCRDNAGSDLLSHTVSHAVPSAVAGLTSVFGMGTGVTLLL